VGKHAAGAAERFWRTISHVLAGETPLGVRDGALLGGVRLEACEVVEEAQGLGAESPGCCGDHRHEPVVLSLKPLVVLGDLVAVGPL
jgi:hypothetical protein